MTSTVGGLRGRGGGVWSANGTHQLCDGQPCHMPVSLPIAERQTAAMLAL